MINVFTNKLKETNEKALPINPAELYRTCTRQVGYEYLRDIQREVLSKWDSIRQQRDVVCKMNTGSGKTITGLLMLYSKMVENKEPSLYLCPDNQLVDQVVAQAEVAGIPVCVFDADYRSELPLDFINSRKILICNFYKLFNGRSIFVKQDVKIGAIVIDDAHKCVDIARTQSSLIVKREHPIAERLFMLFAPVLKKQLQGTFARLNDGDPYLSMRVPYWTWLDEQEIVVNILNEEIGKIQKESVAAWKEGKENKNDNSNLRWEVMKDNLREYDCYISGTQFEITPIHVPYHFFGPFNEARHRYILSATFEDNYDLIKDLGISHESISIPIVPGDRSDVGRRLILAPKRFDPKISDEGLRAIVSKIPGKDKNVVVLVPSDAQAKPWTTKGATLVSSKNIVESLKLLESTKGNFMVFSNRYDGMDLHNESCRVLVIDGLPMHNTIQEHYIETRLDSLKAGKKAQIIEQGLGRAVRSGGDYCVVVLMGIDLLGFLGVDKNMSHFTPITRKQLKVGLSLLDGQDKSNSSAVIEDTITLGLDPKSDWTGYHAQQMLEVPPDSTDPKLVKRLLLADIERKALAEFRMERFSIAGQIIIREIIHGQIELSNKEKGWYYQLAAQLTYLGSRTASNDMQSKAIQHSESMLLPPMGFEHSKIITKGSQASLVKRNIEAFERPQDITNFLNDILSDLVYNPEKSAKAFENALANFGEFLGFTVQMPDSFFGVGPDVLWMATDGDAFLHEAKSQKINGEISKADIEQLMQAESWFKKVYGTDAKYTSVSLQKSNRKSKQAMVEGQMVLDGDSLQKLHDSVIGFASALQTTSTKAQTEESVHALLLAYNLTPQQLRAKFLKRIK